MGDRLGYDDGEYRPPCERGPIYRWDEATGQVEVIQHGEQAQRPGLRERVTMLIDEEVDFQNRILEDSRQDLVFPPRLQRLLSRMFTP